MFSGHSTLLGRAAATVATLAVALFAQPAWSQDAQQGVEIQTRGPVHEAFADVVAMTPTAGFVVPKQPPEPVNEIPPDVKPEGDVTWIPGYWAWDDERNDFLWVSGVWRVPPPNAMWVPGYWAEANGGFQWVNGFWTADEQLQYYPQPPVSLEQGPTSPAPGDNFFYVPGQWIVANGQYAWQPGYWAPYQQGWVWTNSRYVWTPSGYVYVPGRWDYPFAQRGVMFAPAYFSGGVYSRPGFSYRPSLALNVGLLASMLFARPNYGSYYFGDYYGNNYLQAGYQPWYASRNNGFNNNLYGYERWSRRGNDPDWDNRVRGDFDRRVADESARPPRDWQRWQERDRDEPRNRATSGPTGTATIAADPNQNTSLFVSVDQAAKQNIGGRRWETVQADSRERIDGMARQTRELTDQRRKTELEGRANANVGGRPGSATANTGVATTGQAPTDGKPAEARPLSQFRLPKGPQSRVTAKPIDGPDGRLGREPNAGQTPGAVQTPSTAQAPSTTKPPAVTPQAPEVRRPPVVQSPNVPRTPDAPQTPNVPAVQQPNAPRTPSAQPVPNVTNAPGTPNAQPSPNVPNVPGTPNAGRPDVPRGPQNVIPRGDDRPQGRPAGAPGGNPIRGNDPKPPTQQSNPQQRIQVPQPGNNPGQPSQPKVNIPQRTEQPRPQPQAQPKVNVPQPSAQPRPQGRPEGRPEIRAPRGNDNPRPSGGPPQGGGGGKGDKDEKPEKKDKK